jgi:hypothetical protein
VRRPVVCGERGYLLVRLVPAVLALAGPGAAPAEVERHLRCTLQDHDRGDHAAFVMELDGVDSGSVWAHWTSGRFPAAVTVHPDCPASDAACRDVCCEYEGHPGVHTYELQDPWGRE